MGNALGRPLFGLLFFIPLFGLAIGGVFGALFGALEKLGVDKTFQQEVRDMLQPDTSALFMVVDKMTTDKAINALNRYGGTVLKSSLPSHTEKQLQRALPGEDAASLSEPTPAGRGPDGSAVPPAGSARPGVVEGLRKALGVCPSVVRSAPFAWLRRRCGLSAEVVVQEPRRPAKALHALRPRPAVPPMRPDVQLARHASCLEGTMERDRA